MNYFFVQGVLVKREICVYECVYVRVCRYGWHASDASRWGMDPAEATAAAAELLAAVVRC